MKPLLLSAIVLSLCLVVSCSSSPKPVTLAQPTVTPTSTPLPPTETSTPTETLTPTSTHTPVPPTDTPTPEPPTSTPTEVPPTPTPEPPATPEPPTPEPSPTPEPPPSPEQPVSAETMLPDWMNEKPDPNGMQLLWPDGSPSYERGKYENGETVHWPTVLRSEKDGTLVKVGLPWRFIKASDIDPDKLHLIDRGWGVEAHRLKISSGEPVFFFIEIAREDFNRILAYYVANDGLVMICEFDGLIYGVGFPGLKEPIGHYKTKE